MAAMSDQTDTYPVDADATSSTFGKLEDFVPEVVLATDPASPIADEVLRAAWEDVQKLWKRVSKRAPESVRLRINALIEEAEPKLNPNEAGEYPAVSVRDRSYLSKQLVDLQAELRGRLPWEPTFYRDGRLAITRAQDPITIRGAIDHVRVEQFFERYVRDAERAYERLQYFLEKAGLLTEDDKKKELKPWEQPYAQLDTYREMLWGRVRKAI